MACPSIPSKHPKWKGQTRHLAPGRLFIREFEPVMFRERKIGEILIPGQAARGEAFFRKNPDGIREQINVDTSAVFGVVTACGLAVERGTYKPFAPDIQEMLGFPLPPGTLVILSKQNQYTVGSDQSFQTTELHEWVFPWEDRPEWGPE